jgi:hypothetical protein
MMLELTQIDPFDAPAVDLWWDIYAAAERADRGADTATNPGTSCSRPTGRSTAGRTSHASTA